jgi:hypothetical protein
MLGQEGPNLCTLLFMLQRHVMTPSKMAMRLVWTVVALHVWDVLLVATVLLTVTASAQSVTTQPSSVQKV